MDLICQQSRAASAKDELQQATLYNIVQRLQSTRQHFAPMVYCSAKRKHQEASGFISKQSRAASDLTRMISSEVLCTISVVCIAQHNPTFSWHSALLPEEKPPRGQKMDVCSLHNIICHRLDSRVKSSFWSSGQQWGFVLIISHCLESKVQSLEQPLPIIMFSGVLCTISKMS